MVELKDVGLSADAQGTHERQRGADLQASVSWQHLSAYRGLQRAERYTWVASLSAEVNDAAASTGVSFVFTTSTLLRSTGQWAECPSVRVCLVAAASSVLQETCKSLCPLAGGVLWSLGQEV